MKLPHIAPLLIAIGIIGCGRKKTTPQKKNNLHSVLTLNLPIIKHFCIQKKEETVHLSWDSCKSLLHARYALFKFNKNGFISPSPTYLFPHHKTTFTEPFSLDALYAIRVVKRKGDTLHYGPIAIAQYT